MKSYQGVAKVDQVPLLNCQLWQLVLIHYGKWDAGENMFKCVLEKICLNVCFWSFKGLTQSWTYFEVPKYLVCFFLFYWTPSIKFNVSFSLNPSMIVPKKNERKMKYIYQRNEILLMPVRANKMKESIAHLKCVRYGKSGLGAKGFHFISC